MTTESTPGTTNNEQQTRVGRATYNSPKPMQAPETRAIQEGTHQKIQLKYKTGTTRTRHNKQTRRADFKEQETTDAGLACTLNRDVKVAGQRRKSRAVMDTSSRKIPTKSGRFTKSSNFRLKKGRWNSRAGTTGLA